ncbi:hypothetical protein K402DRAFT_450438 [Aulographum hederae CBS 113979]|uniref:YCII-related domain-containing protein n=1 Tax=Aulographum hederae CBS 113979 TaxID=1176131 RepID=A0A6G1HF16_9PEZI|nr:hypothetical protein K402DRAFT_450438 [Aulographum hederae CBS 113979]
MPRFVVLINTNQDAENGKTPDPEFLKELSAYHSRVAKSGHLLWSDGLHPSGHDGVRMTWDGKAWSDSKGPFPNPETLLGGYSILRCKDLAEVQQLIKDGPALANEKGTVEIRRLADIEDFPAEILTEEMKAHALEMKKTMWANATSGQ